jgi:CheY-like chemotaxis protein
MRSMMFGEEHPAPRASRYGRRFHAKPEPKPVVEESAAPQAETEPVAAQSEPVPDETEPLLSHAQSETAEPAVEQPTEDQQSLGETPTHSADNEESSFPPAASMEQAIEQDQPVEVSTGSWEVDQPTFAGNGYEASTDEPASSLSEASPDEGAASSETTGDQSETSPASGPVEAAAVGDSGSTSADETPQGSGPTMVIIDDDESVAQYYATLFKGNGYRVEVANDGVSGVDLCSKVQPAVILLDVMMPRQNGILVLQTLRASDETRDTPVVVLSNFSEPTLIKRALQLGALEYVIKTQVEGAALLAAVPRWLNREKAFAA